jgi:PAS domain S-box-containing protein
MQGAEGLELVRLIRLERLLDLPIVMLAGQDSEQLASSALHLGVDDYLVKHQGYLFELPATLEKVHRRAELAREELRLRDTNQRMSQLLASSPTIVYSLRVQGGRVRSTWVSENVRRILGYEVAEALQPNWWLAGLHPQDRSILADRLPQLLSEGWLSQDYRFHRRDGSELWVRDELRRVSLQGGDWVDFVGSWTDITADRRASLIGEARADVLDRIVAAKPLGDILEAIALRMQAIEASMRVSIQLLHELSGRIVVGAAPSFPDFYTEALEDLQPAPDAGSCGASAWSGEPVLVADVLDHPNWTKYTDLARRVGFRACWSVPFKDEDGRVLGTFAVYHDTVCLPDAAQLSLITDFSRITGLAVQKVRAANALRQAAAVFESTRDGVFITDLDARIVAVNPAFTEISGYSEAEVDRPDAAHPEFGPPRQGVLSIALGSVLASGHWQGEVWNRRKNGEVYPQLLTISTVRNEAGRSRHYVAVMTDISQLKMSEAKLDYLAHHDPLTDLPNRLLLQSRIQHAIDRAIRTLPSSGAAVHRSRPLQERQRQPGASGRRRTACGHCPASARPPARRRYAGPSGR